MNANVYCLSGYILCIKSIDDFVDNEHCTVHSHEFDSFLNTIGSTFLDVKDHEFINFFSVA